MAENYNEKIAKELNLEETQVKATVELLENDSSVPFIARYRKELTGELDEVDIFAIRDRMEQLRALDKRKDAILKSLEEQGNLSDDLKSKVLEAETLAILEDIYLPYRPKRRTRGMMAKEKGLEPLALKIFEQGDMDIETEAAAFVNIEKGVETVTDALAGARDIIAEWINEDGESRAVLRTLYTEKAIVRSRVAKNKEEEGIKYRDYFDWEEPAATTPSHRMLAIRRGAEEGYLIFRIVPDEDEAVMLLEGRFLKGENRASEHVRQALRDSYKRLLSPSMELEIRLELKKRADDEAIKVFAGNLRELLLASPLGQKAVLGIDPGYRTGCKVVCLNPQGKLLNNKTIYPIEPHNKKEQSADILKSLVSKYQIDAIAIGNGTGGRETEAFCKEITFDRPVVILIVNENGASVYSASEVAREEFPDHDITVRGAVSIGRRLMDPLAELVKIEPKSIGVGQYQHDVDQKALKASLDDVVSSCVNAVGVEVNTASKELLKYVSGLSERLSGNIIRYRNENGPFISRISLMDVSGMGPKAFEQSAGFLRIRGAENPLDASAVHPESYTIVETMAQDMRCSIYDLMNNAAFRSKISLEKYVTDKVGIPTLNDIMKELAKPGRDPREQFEPFSFSEGINHISDLEIGMQLPGIVTNVAAFGAFVDIGVHQDGLVHVSEISDRFVRNPNDFIKVNQRVTVTVTNIDSQRNRISLSMKSRPFEKRIKVSDSTNSIDRKKVSLSKGHEKKKKEPANPFAAALKDFRVPE
ncbi:MAG TPA: Tex family protein [Desulfobacteraceae bacterium]|nr:Tex family protein [Desulfobacteraceae bacterium]HPJ67127.1 Tex family protein [Desulfobacteraceae bacterium]